MIVLLAAGVGVSLLGLLAIGVGIPISESSFGNALLIAGVVVLCTGLILIGMWFLGRELAGIAKLLAQGARAPESPGAVSVRPSPRPPVFPGMAADEPAAPTPGPLTSGQPRMSDGSQGNGVPPPWADEAASRPRPRLAASEIPSVAVDAPPAPPSTPDRPARRNLLFATRRRDKPEHESTSGEAAPLPTPALEFEPRVSFDNAWPTSSRPNGATDRKDTSAGMAVSVNAGTGHLAPHAQPESAEHSEDATVIKSGVVDGMAYTLYSDGSIEAEMVGEGLVRFASLEALRTYLDQRQ